MPLQLFPDLKMGFPLQSVHLINNQGGEGLTQGWAEAQAES